MPYKIMGKIHYVDQIMLYIIPVLLKPTVIAQLHTHYISDEFFFDNINLN